MSTSIHLNAEHVQMNEVVIPEGAVDVLTHNGIDPGKILHYIMVMRGGHLPLRDTYTFKFHQDNALGDDELRLVHLTFRELGNQFRLKELTIDTKEEIEESAQSLPGMTLQRTLQRYEDLYLDVSLVEPIPRLIIVPGIIEFDDITVHISNEMSKNIKGYRGSYHQVPLNVVEKFLAERPIKQWLLETLEDAEKDRQRGIFYFKWKKVEKSEVIIKIILLRNSEGRRTVLTSFRPVSSHLKMELNIRSSSRFEAWKSFLPLIDETQ